MRLKCPNCDAQYEVPDQVIPFEGRDVQCSNCGTTWFQEHPDNPRPAPTETTNEHEPATATDHDGGRKDDTTAYDQVPEHDEVAHGSQARDADDDSTGFADSGEQEYEDDPHDGDPVHSPGEQPVVDQDVADLLREEAEREARLREEENAGGLESQPELGLDEIHGDAQRRAEEARARMARLRGEEASSPPEPENDEDNVSRRGLLPDIEEINSSLKSTSSAVAPALPSEEAPSRGRSATRGGFSRGFALVLLIGVILLLIYTNAPRISAAVPQVDPVLNAYVTAVDSARVWLDQQMARLTPNQ